MGSGVSFMGKRTQGSPPRGETAQVGQVQTSSTPLATIENAVESNEIVSGADSRRSRSTAENGPFSPARFSSASNLDNSNQSSPLRNRSSRSSPNMQQPQGGGSRESNDRESMDMFRRAAVIAYTVSSDGSENSAMDTFAHTALSLGMDSEDLLFNMMFFDDGTVPNFGSLVNTLQQETVALHSENNTPYKLNPAKDSVISSLKFEKFHVSVTDYETECAVCKDEIDDDAEILRVPYCGHYFHSECLMKWIHLQAWCPVCRASLDNITEKKSPRSANIAYPPTIKEDISDNNTEEKCEPEGQQHQEIPITVAKRLNFDTFLDSMMSADNLAGEKVPISHQSADDKKSIDYKSCAKEFDLMEELDQTSDDNFPHYKSPECSMAEGSIDQIIAAAVTRAMQRR
jgi:hypothetical protein